MTVRLGLALLLGYLICVSAQAQMAEEQLENLPAEISEEELLSRYQAYLDSLEATLTFYSDTTITLGDDLADLTIPVGYSFIGAADGKTVLTEMWGNPPETAYGTLGMLFPSHQLPASMEGYGIDISFSDEGYIEDNDAAYIDYDDLLQSMQEDTEAGNEARIQAGYDRMHLLGWASPPYYDASNKRLHWAKELQFDDVEGTTLNYNVLFLGRKGYLTMNAIGTMEDLPAISDKLDGILQSVAFKEGQRYSDFNPDVDKVAAYGIGALIAGKVLAKTGVLAALGVFLLKAWKLIAIGLVALGAGLKKFLGR